jgi:hypothetical protein
MKFDDIPDDSSLQSMVAEQEYFYLHLPTGKQLLHIKDKESRLPLGFGRHVLLAELMGIPERAEWKACQVDATEQPIAEPYSSAHN